MIKKHSKIFLYIFIIFVSLFMVFITVDVNSVNKKSIFIYKGKARLLALSVYTNNSLAIKFITHISPELVDTADDKFDCPILIWAVGNNKYTAAEALLEAGANVNCYSSILGTTPILEAAGYQWTNAKRDDTRFLQLLIDYGADVNVILKNNDNNDLANYDTPLLKSLGTGINKTKLLVDSGADINYRSNCVVSNLCEKSISLEAVMAFGPTSTKKIYDYIRYLFIEKHADIISPTKFIDSNGEEVLVYPIDIIIDDWDFDYLESSKKDEFNSYKEEIISEIERQAKLSNHNEVRDYNTKRIQAYYTERSYR